MICGKNCKTIASLDVHEIGEVWDRSNSGEHCSAAVAWQTSYLTLNLRVELISLQVL
jgi:hypothetical protein